MPHEKLQELITEKKKSDTDKFQTETLERQTKLDEPAGKQEIRP